MFDGVDDLADTVTYAALNVAAPMESAAGAQRAEAVATLWDDLKALAEDLAPEEQRTARSGQVVGGGQPARVR